MKNIFVYVVCFIMISGASLLAAITEKEAAKVVADLKVKKTEISSRLKVSTEKYIEYTQAVAKMKHTIRSGRTVIDKYNKTGVDEETVALIDRCLAAEKKYAELNKELNDRLAQSEAGKAKEKQFTDAVNKIQEFKEAQSDMIQSRAKVLHEEKIIKEDLAKAELELKAIQESKTISNKEK